MKNINFHSLKNTPVPEELKKSVIAVPERSGTKRKVYPGRMIRFAVAAAFLAVITAVSVPLFMNIGNAPIPVIPAATEGAQAPSYPSAVYRESDRKAHRRTDSAGHAERSFFARAVGYILRADSARYRAGYIHPSSHTASGAHAGSHTAAHGRSHRGTGKEITGSCPRRLRRHNHREGT